MREAQVFLMTVPEPRAWHLLHCGADIPDEPF